MLLKYIIGIDEVGRGPLAGPVAVGAILATPDMLQAFTEIKESKQLSEKKRELWNDKILAARGEGLRSVVCFVPAEEIDVIGIAPAIKKALKEGLVQLAVDPTECRVLLDGGLYAPEEYINQETIIGGDGKETIIAMASVVAKVARDRLMVQLAESYPEYDFAKHKGYGTKAHMDAIRTHGLSKEHRRSFCKNI
ncbi:MAG TPA: ribonuclease HII [Candidatus Paceibacterota bacterium]|nr:ribonuclease HII [Candidatus Paceibacterota bacterium]